MKKLIYLSLNITLIITTFYLGHIEGSSNSVCNNTIFSINQEKETTIKDYTDLIKIKPSSAEFITSYQAINSLFVASKKSTSKIYHSINSSIANRIKPENRIYFKTVEEAEKQGFKPSSQLKSLSN